MHLWSNHAAGVDQALDFEIGVGRDAAGGANRRDAERQVEARKTDAHVGVHRRRAIHGKEHVIVHADDAGQDAVAVQIERLCVSRDRDAFGWSKRLDLAAVNDDCLILCGRCARAVDNAHVSQRDHGGVGANELAVGCLRKRGDRKREEQEDRDCWSHGVEDNRIYVICVV